MKNFPWQTLITGTALAALLSACVSIPGAYRGTFQNKAGDVRLSLSMNKGSLELLDENRLIQSKTADYSFKAFQKAIQEGRSAIFGRKNAANERQLDLFWVKPKLDTLQEAEGLTWFEAEVIYTRLNRDQKDKVQTLSALHATEGTVIIDGPTETVQVGWPANPTEYRLRRINDKAVHPKED
jgi:hypothetical protein